MTTITDLGFTSNGKRLYHVKRDAADTGTTVNVPCMQILATVPHHTFSGNTLDVAATTNATILVIAA